MCEVRLKDTVVVFPRRGLWCGEKEKSSTTIAPFSARLQYRNPVLPEILLGRLGSMEPWAEEEEEEEEERASPVALEKDRSPVGNAEAGRGASERRKAVREMNLVICILGDCSRWFPDRR